jgi:predicted DCC family thiol-disulfide oxidoreductase YuxK
MRPVLLYDGQCPFCRRSARLLAQLAGQRVEVLAYQQAAPRFAGMSPFELNQAAHLVYPDGSVVRGSQAIAAVLAAGGIGWPLRAWRRWPWLARASERLYRIVARHRPRCGSGCSAPDSRVD